MGDVASMGNSQSVKRISQLRGRGGLEPGPSGIGYGAGMNPGGLEGANSGSVRQGQAATVLLTLIAGAALFVFSTAKPTREHERRRAAEHRTVDRLEPPQLKSL